MATFMRMTCASWRYSQVVASRFFMEIYSNYACGPVKRDNAILRQVLALSFTSPDRNERFAIDQ
jgi:hypothetical protein